VVAIALTLLVLQLRVPVAVPSHAASALARQLAKESSSFTAYLISFFVIAQFWLAHHRTFRKISGHVEGLAWLNFVFLLTISILPFSSDLLGAYQGNPLAVDIFAFNLLLASLSTQAVALFGRRKRLLVASVSPSEIRDGQIRSLGAMAVAALSMAVAWVTTEAAQTLWLLFLVVPVVARRRTGVGVAVAS
jgi:uncharacterized membrane protein